MNEVLPLMCTSVWVRRKAPGGMERNGIRGMMKTLGTAVLHSYIPDIVDSIDGSMAVIAVT